LKKRVSRIDMKQIVNGNRFLVVWYYYYINISYRRRFSSVENHHVRPRVIIHTTEFPVGTELLQCCPNEWAPTAGYVEAVTGSNAFKIGYAYDYRYKALEHLVVAYIMLYRIGVCVCIIIIVWAPQQSDIYCPRRKCTRWTREG